MDESRPFASSQWRIRPPETVEKREERGRAAQLHPGYVDTCLFVALFGLFTAQVTGNFVLIGAELVHHGVGIASKLLSAGTTRTRWPRARTRPDTLPAGSARSRRARRAARPRRAAAGSSAARRGCRRCRRW